MDRYFIVNYSSTKNVGQLNIVCPNGGYIIRKQIEDHLATIDHKGVIITGIIEMTPKDYNQYMGINMSIEDEVEALCNYFLKQ